jgi:hypothetical protein
LRVFLVDTAGVNPEVREPVELCLPSTEDDFLVAKLVMVRAVVQLSKGDFFTLFLGIREGGSPLQRYVNLAEPIRPLHSRALHGQRFSVRDFMTWKFLFVSLLTINLFVFE